MLAKIKEVFTNYTRMTVVVPVKDVLLFETILDSTEGCIYDKIGSETRSVIAIKVPDKSYKYLMETLHLWHRNLKQTTEFGLITELVEWKKVES